jgi:hypothetical protein
MMVGVKVVVLSGDVCGFGVDERFSLTRERVTRDRVTVGFLLVEGSLAVQFAGGKP